MVKTEGRRVAMRVQDFAAGKKGVTRAIKEFKVRKQRKVQKKAVLLRKYKKVIKKEGYNVQRPKLENPLAKQKTNNSQKSTAQDDKGKSALEEQQRQAEAKQQQRQAQEKKRHDLSQKLSKRTRKGQPVMKYVIHNILDKLQKEES
jgi:hypothetical protein